MRFLIGFLSLVLFVGSVASAQVIFTSYSCKGTAVVNGRKGTPVPYQVLGVSHTAGIGTLQVSENNQELSSPNPVTFTEESGVLTFSNTARTETLKVYTTTPVKGGVHGTYDKHIPDANFVEAANLTCYLMKVGPLAPPKK